MREFRDETNPAKIADLVQGRLFSYSDSITQWAERVSGIFLRKAEKADYEDWKKLSEKLGKETRKILKEHGKGETFRALQSEQIILIKSLPQDAAKKVHEWAVEGMHKGERYDSIAQRIFDEIGIVTRNHATLIARTEASRAKANFQQARAMALGSSEYQWITMDDYRVRPLHARLDGRIFRWDSPPATDIGRGGQWLHSHPGAIFNCFTGDTLVRLDRRIRKVIRSPFDGRVVDIRTSGASVTATPNHPMLTQRGWVAAGEIREGDYLLQPLGDAIHVIEADKERSHVRIADLFDAFAAEGVTAPGVLFDFYGDRPNGEVDTAPVKWELIFDKMPQLLKSIPDLGLSRPSGVVDGVRLNAFDMRGAGGGRETASLGEWSSFHTKKHRFATVSDSESVIFEAVDNNGSGNTERLGNRQDGFPAGVSADDFSFVKFEPIVGWASCFGDDNSNSSEVLAKDIGRVVDSFSGLLKKCPRLYQGFRVEELVFRDFLGHVYTLETEMGWYNVTTCNFTVKNCRCRARPLLPEGRLEE